MQSWQSNAALKNEYPRLGSTSLSMLEAQCNKLARKSYPPLADAAIGVGCHPYKEEVPPSKADQQSAVSVNGLQPPSHLETPYQRPVTYLAFDAFNVYRGENIFDVTPPPPQSGSQYLTGQVDPNSFSPLGGSYSRGATEAYESWPNTMNAPVKMAVSSSFAHPWWDVGGAGSATPLLDMSGEILSLDNYSTNSSHLPNLHPQDTYTFMLPVQDRGGHFENLASPPPTQLPSAQSQRLNSGCTTCNRPNCVEGKQQGLSLANRRKRYIHRCHILGCRKVYERLPHLNAHLKIHKSQRPFSCKWLFCGMSFTENVLLKDHLRTHSDGRRFECHICGKWSLRSDHLTVHVLTHYGTGEVKKTGFSSGSCSDSENS